MMNLVRKRRSIRTYTREPVGRESLDLLVEAMLRSPSSRNRQPWEFVIVDDPQLLSKLSEAKEHGSGFLQNAPLGIVVCADSTKSDVWVEDCSIAAILVQMVAQSLGLGSCWIQIRNRMHDGQKTAEKHIQDILGLPERIKVVSMISIGHPDETKQPVHKSALGYNQVKYNHYSGNYPVRK